MIYANPTRELSTWETPATSYPRRKVGKAAIRSSTYVRGYYESYNTNGGLVYRLLKPIKITSLVIGRQTWMVDDPPHWWAMQDHARAMCGHVLCGGLGLGLMAHALMRNPKVERVTIVEQDRDVIKLVAPLIPSSCEIVQGNFWHQEIQADSVLLDILVGNGRDLVMQAFGQYVRLRHQWPSQPIRIHGFDNGQLERDYLGLIAAKFAAVR